MEFGEMKRNTSNWSNFCILLSRAGLSASAGLSCLKVSTVLVSTTSTGRLFHREGAATQNARLASSVRVLGTIRRGVLEGRSVLDGM